MKKEFKKTPEKIPEKKEYIPPRIDIVWVELEQGIANGSTFISTIPGEVQTEWEGVDDQQETEVIF
ncbi:hypothetical protein OZ668_10835 [Elizabethkingia sp. HX XZB]|uniref:hypothetical protein n=1 Tax=Elizabethkingia sp. HX XZB TaxID=3003193 RepID=UPI002A246AEB|nr:hypothetical protein [Elizabethkingia sp. HX XZB]MDX8568486.1 hypothetical protein [Elizabethkingia sp. HX XZB]